jgi:mycothiol synthase
MREMLQWFWTLATVDLARDTVVIEADGSVAAYGDTMWDPSVGGPLSATIRVHPGHHGRGLGSALAAWAEEASAERGAAGLRHEVLAADRAAAELLASRGYVEVRTSWTMGRPLSGDEVATGAPEGVSIRAFEPGDERAVFEVHEASFADHWGFRQSTFESFTDMWFRAGGDFDPSLLFLAEEGGATIGHAATLVNEAGGYVYSLGVVRSARGRGIAQALLHRTFAVLAARGQRDVTLGVDASNPTGAVALYRKVGMEVRREYRQWDLGTEAAADAVAMAGSSPG